MNAVFVSVVVLLTVAAEQQEVWRRPRSSTEPAITLDLPVQQRWERRRGKEAGSQMKNRRTFSLDSGHCSVKNTALVPQNVASPVETLTSTHRERTKQPDVLSPEQTLLPPVVRPPQGTEGEMRIEVRSFRKSEQSSTHNKEPEIGVVAKLPHISSHSPPSQASRSEQTSEASEEATLDGKRDSGKRVSVVSLGETTTLDRPRLRARKRHKSGSKEGKLSLGWSPTKPLEPVTGHSVHQNVAKEQERVVMGECEGVQTMAGLHAGEAVMSTDSNCIQIDAHEYLDV